MINRDSIIQCVLENGYVSLQAFEPELPSEKAIELLGDIDIVEGIRTIQALTPKGPTNSTPNTYSGNFGTSEFPLHTDLAHWAIPPRYLALRCVHGTPKTATRIYNAKGLINEFGSDILRMCLVRPRRTMRNGKQMLRLLELTEFSCLPRLRWDNLYLEPANSLTRNLFPKIKEFISMSQPYEIFLSCPGDTIIIDNWRCLHGRSLVLASENERHIDRAYLRSI